MENTEKTKTAGKQSPYRWVICFACCLMLFVSWGFCSNTKSIFLDCITGQMGLDRGLFTIGNSIGYLISGVLFFFAEKVIRKFGTRRMIFVGFVLFAASSACYAMAQGYALIYIAGALYGLGIVWIGSAMVGILLESWFSEKKGTVMGIAFSMSGIGYFAAENVLTRIIYGADGSIPVENARWRLAQWVMAGLFLAVGILVAVLVRENPDAESVAPSEKPREKEKGTWIGVDPKDVLRKPYFYMIGFCILTTGMILESKSGTARAFMADTGIPQTLLITLFSTSALWMTITKVLAGSCFDLFGIRKVYLFCCFAAIILLLGLIFLPLNRQVLPWVYVVFNPLAIPLQTIATPLITIEMFGKRSYAKVLCIFMALDSLGCVVGVPIVNAVYDCFGTYLPAYIVMTFLLAAVMVIAPIAMSMAKKERLKMAKAEETEKKETV